MFPDAHRTRFLHSAGYYNRAPENRSEARFLGRGGAALQGEHFAIRQNADSIGVRRRAQGDTGGRSRCFPFCHPEEQRDEGSLKTIRKNGKITLLPFFPYRHTDGGECGAHKKGVPRKARRRGEKPPQSRRRTVNGRFPPSSRKILLSAQKNFRELICVNFLLPHHQQLLQIAVILPQVVLRHLVLQQV